MSSKKKQIDLAIKKIELELEAIKEEGLETPDCWYAIDRLEVVKEVCEKLIDEHENG